MQTNVDDGVMETITLRFEGETEDGKPLHELKASHVAEVLEGLVGLTSDFAKAGAFGDDGPLRSELLVHPPKEGSFILEVLRIIQENPDVAATTAAVTGVPTLSQIIWWATKSVRAEVSDFDYLENDKVKVSWQDGTVQEIPVPAWEELQKRDRRRKKQLRQIMAPLSDQNVTSLELQASPAHEATNEDFPEIYTLTQPDYQAAR